MSNFQYNLMEEDSLSFGIANAKKNYMSRLNSNSGDYSVEFGDLEDDYEIKSGYPCPYCLEDLDLEELCWHIDEEHPMEAMGECPVCEVEVEMDMIEHITTHHRNIFKSQHILRQRKLEYHSAFPCALKELKDMNWESIGTFQPHAVSTSKVEPDPVMSFLGHVPAIVKKEDWQPYSTNINSEKTGFNETMVESWDRTLHALLRLVDTAVCDMKTYYLNVTSSALSSEDQIEQTRRSGFLQGLIMSIILGDD